ncbi:MAG: sigma-70 family RNA polymerase sigma factor [Planctomycetaceae bacterium]|jgi:RNA polymerase sigma-70 factor (ECF subfamily)|nr:sigma-70 family RNA polymerase sigma factor [Planctomycetaceae bacterium]
MIADSSVNLNLQDTDIRLMLAVQQDDASAFEELMLRYQNRVLSLLRHLIGNRDMAEDLTQEVFLRVFRARKNYQPGAKFTTWLFTITNNVALNALRTRHRKPEVQLGLSRNNEDSGERKFLAEDSILASSGTIPTRHLDKLEMKQMVQLAVEALGERQRMAILLHKFEGLSYIDIANVMDMTPQGVKSLLCRARLNLRDSLQGYMQRGKKVESVISSQ